MIGIYPNLSNEQYHAHDSISRSKLMDFSISPYQYWAMHLNPDRPEKKVTDAMEFGTAFHTWMLEQDNFKKQFYVKPEPVLLKDSGREAYEAYKELLKELSSNGRHCLSQDQYDCILDMYKALIDHNQAHELIWGAKAYEQSYFWQDKESGLLVKARPDILHSNMIVDLKTCASASPQAIQRAIVDGGYHTQMAMIRDGIRELEGRDIPNCILVCVEKTYPYAIGIYIIDEQALEIGRLEYKRLLLNLVSCIKSNSWPGHEIQTINLPRWAL